MKLLKLLLFLLVFNLYFKAFANVALEDYYNQKIINRDLAFKVYSDVNRFSKEFNVDEKLITAIIEVESNFSNNIISKKGAVGFMQLMPGTGELLNININDPTENIYGGIKYFSILLKKNNNDLSLALAAYNSGMGNVTKYDSIPPFPETQNYVNRVLDIYQQLSGNNLNFYSNEFSNTNFDWESKNESENTK